MLDIVNANLQVIIFYYVCIVYLCVRVNVFPGIMAGKS